jgi:hypothetical protein
MMLCCASCAFVSSPNSFQAKVPKARKIGIRSKQSGFIKSEKVLTYHGTQAPTYAISTSHALEIAPETRIIVIPLRCLHRAMRTVPPLFLFPSVHPGKRISNQVPSKKIKLDTTYGSIWLSSGICVSGNHGFSHDLNVKPVPKRL